MTSLISLVSGQFTRSLILGAFFPVVLFLTLAILALGPVLPNGMDLIQAFQELETPSEILLFTLFAVVLTVFLYNLNIPIIRLYEGYPWLESKIGQWRKRKFTREYDEIRRLIPRLRAVRDAWKSVDENHKNIGELQQRLDRLGQKLSLTFPTEAGFMLPTTFGNVIRSFETYPFGQYGIDAIAFWSRLASIASKDTLAGVEEAKSSVDFFINCSVLSALLAALLFTIACIVAGPTVALSALILLSVETFAALFCSFLFYRGAIGRAAAWGEEVKSVFDLHRWDLLKKIGYQQTPSTRAEERQLWEAITKQTLYGDPPFYPPLPYKVVPEARTTVSPDPPDLELQVSGGTTVNWIGRRAYTYQITNVDTKRRAARNVRLVEQLPADVEYVWGSARTNGRQCQVRGINPVEFQLGPLAVEETIEVSYSGLLKVEKDFGGAK